MATLTETKARPERKPLPAPNSDFYHLAETLPPDELAVVKQVRAFMESKVAPIATKYWADDAFPFELISFCGHLVPEERPDELASLLRQLLAR